MLLKNSIQEVLDLLYKHQKADYFYINSYHFNSELLKNYKHPINTDDLPKNLSKFSNFPNSFYGKFIEFINPKISFDFLSILHKRYHIFFLEIFCAKSPSFQNRGHKI